MRISLLGFAALLATACGGGSNSSADAGDPGPTFDAGPLPDAARPACSPQAATPEELRLEEVANGLTNNLTYVTAPAGDRRLFVTEQPGRIRVIDAGAVQDAAYLDIVDRVQSSSNEQGLLGLAFHPNFASNGQFYVNYTANNPDFDDDEPTCSDAGSEWLTVVSEFTVSDPRNSTVSAASERVLLTIPQFASNHNGGMLAFGPDGMLYISVGDGGGGGDPCDTGQELNSLLGKLLRIDVSGSPSTVPADNPFDGANERPEIWAYGLRNPWRFSFDRMTGDLYIGDVGQNRVEEINAVPASSTGGENYGWRTAEGDECFNIGGDFEIEGGPCDRTGFTEPIVTYDHPAGVSVTGGFVYRGTCLQGIEGTYFYSDAASGFFRTINWTAGGGVAGTDELDNFGDGANLGSITAFGEDSTGELYVVSRNGRIFRVVKP